MLSRRLLSLGHRKGYIHKTCDTALYCAGPEAFAEKKKYSHDNAPPGQSEGHFTCRIPQPRGQGQAVTTRAVVSYAITPMPGLKSRDILHCQGHVVLLT